MNGLKLVPEQQINKKNLKLTNETESYAQLSETDLVQLFPLPRYFQIHFQHAHENIDELKKELANLENTISQMNSKIDLLIQLLTQTRN